MDFENIIEALKYLDNQKTQKIPFLTIAEKIIFCLLLLPTAFIMGFVSMIRNIIGAFKVLAAKK